MAEKRGSWSALSRSMGLIFEVDGRNWAWLEVELRSTLEDSPDEQMGPLVYGFLDGPVACAAGIEAHLTRMAMIGGKIWRGMWPMGFPNVAVISSCSCQTAAKIKSY